MKKTMSKKWKWGLWTSGVVLGAVALVFALRSGPGDTKEGQTAKVERGDLALAVTEVGSLEPLRKIEVKSKVAGQVADVLVDVGAKVRAGDVLIRLAPTDAERSLKEAEARAAVNAANLKQARAELVMKQKAQAMHALSELELNVAAGAVGNFEAQAAVWDVEIARARDQLGYTQIRAPIDGTVLARNVEPGEMVPAGVASLVDGKPLLVVAQTESLLVRTELNQLDIAKVRLEQKAEVTIDALPGKVFSGSVLRVAAMAQKSERRKDSALMVFPVDVAVPTDQAGAEAMKPGMMAEVRIPIDAKKDILTVPVVAIVRSEGKTKLLTLKDGKEIEVDVVLGAQNDKQAEVISGVAMGDTVKISPSSLSRRN